MTCPAKAAPTLRTATPADAALLADLGRRTFDGAFRGFIADEHIEPYLWANFTPERLAADLSDPASLFLVAEIDGEPAGYARLHFGDPHPSAAHLPTPVKLWRLYAMPEWYGRGVGAALMAGCMDATRGRGGGSLWLTVNIDNARAIGFYERWGFAVVGRADFPLGGIVHVDHVMARRVED